MIDRSVNLTRCIQGLQDYKHSQLSVWQSENRTDVQTTSLGFFSETLKSASQVIFQL